MVSIPSFQAQREAWRAVPIDDVGYFDTQEMMEDLSHGELRELIEAMAERRYGGWRNHENRWRDALGLDSITGKRLLDYGCGVGLEALQYARRGNRVTLADINAATVKLAARVLAIHGVPAFDGLVIGDPPSLIPAEESGSFDVIVCNGVLHHIPDPRPTVELFHQLLAPGGEVRLMLYAAGAWRLTVGTEPPEDVYTNSGFEWFVRSMDQVGGWADWYDQDRLEARFGDLFTVANLTHLTPDDRYLAATLIPRAL